jgi:hypothetical protein
MKTLKCFMPWREHGRLDDVQLRALYAFLQQAKCWFSLLLNIENLKHLFTS